MPVILREIGLENRKGALQNKLSLGEKFTPRRRTWRLTFLFTPSLAPKTYPLILCAGDHPSSCVGWRIMNRKSLWARAAKAILLLAALTAPFATASAQQSETKDASVATAAIKVPTATQSDRFFERLWNFYYADWHSPTLPGPRLSDVRWMLLSTAHLILAPIGVMEAHLRSVFRMAIPIR